MAQIITLYIGDDVLEVIDNRRGMIPRSPFMVDLIKKQLGGIKDVRKKKR